MFMKKSFKTFEEFIGDETTDSLKAKAEELQQKDGDKIVGGVQGGSINGDNGPQSDGDDSGDEMGTDV